MKRQDKPVHEARMSNARKQHDRKLAIYALVAQGHVEIMQDLDPVCIRVRVADEYFADLRGKFPSEELLARVQLAVNAGNSCCNITAIELDRRWGKLVETAFRRGGNLFLGDAHIGQSTNTVTATVKKPAGRPRP